MGLSIPSSRTVKRFFEAVHAQPVGMLCGHGCDDLDAVTVGVGLHNSHHGSARCHNGPKSIKVPSNSGCIDFNPAQHRNILFYGRHECLDRDFRPTG